MALNTYKHSYPLANSDESTRLQNQHEVLKDEMGGLVLAPVDLVASSLRILDSGTADGNLLYLIHNVLFFFVDSIKECSLDLLGAL